MRHLPIRIIELRHIRVTPVFALRRHHPLKSRALRPLAVDEQLRRRDPQFIARRPHQPLDIKLRRLPRRRAGVAHLADALRIENENVPPARRAEMVGELVHKHMIPRLHIAPRDGLALFISPLGVHPETLRHRPQRRVDQVGIAPAGHQLRVGHKKKARDLPRVRHRLIVLGHDIHPPAPQRRLLKKLHRKIRRLLRRGMAHDPVQRRPHRARRDRERLEKIRPHPQRHHDRHEEHLAVFPPARVLRRRQILPALPVQRLRRRLDFPLLPCPARLLQPRDPALEIRGLSRAPQVPLVGQQLARVLHKLAALFDVLRGEK